MFAQKHEMILEIIVRYGTKSFEENKRQEMLEIPGKLITFLKDWEYKNFHKLE